MTESANKYDYAEALHFATQRMNSAQKAKYLNTCLIESRRRAEAAEAMLNDMLKLKDRRRKLDSLEP